MDEPVNSLVGEKLRACIEVNRKTNWPYWPAPPFIAFSYPGEPLLYPTRSHLLWWTLLQSKREGQIMPTILLIAPTPCIFKPFYGSGTYLTHPPLVWHLPSSSFTTFQIHVWHEVSQAKLKGFSTSVDGTIGYDRSSREQVPKKDAHAGFQILFIMFHYIISITYQKTGDLFYSLIFLDFRKVCVYKSSYTQSHTSIVCCTLESKVYPFVKLLNQDRLWYMIILDIWLLLISSQKMSFLPKLILLWELKDFLIPILRMPSIQILMILRHSLFS